MPDATKKRSRVQEHPAESATGLAGAIFVILAALGVEVDETVLVAVVGGIAALPALVTAIVNRVRESL